MYLRADVYNGPITTPQQANAAGISPTGCMHRGTTACHDCPHQPVALCGWTCASCCFRELCPCGTPELARYRPACS